MMKQLPLLPLLLLFSLLTGNSSACTNADSKVISTEGTDVILPCSPSTRENLQNKLFDWKKVDQGGDTQHEVFMYDSAVHYEHHSGQSEQFKGRVSHFQNELKHGNASIFIRKTKVIDSGSYTCYFPRLQPDEKFCIELIVGASPKPSVKTIDQANSWARLQCEVHGANPEPKVEWWDSSGNILPAEEPQVLKNGKKSYDVTVNITVTKTDRYRCVATQEEIKHQISAEILVYISGEESEKSSGAASKPYVKVVDQTKDWSLLQCLVRGAYPKPLLEWRNSSGNIVPAAEPQVSEREGSYDVILQTTVTKTDRYHCVVTQEEISHETRAETFVHITGGNPEKKLGFVLSDVALVALGGVVVVVILAGVVVELCIPQHRNGACSGAMV
ncbi:hypothetical protein F7725_016454 [Dissostichus mawsoni]|uniref:Ig-like domain-containing protein n=1 Tax=Dissostichus mawsoni TaxID=36200 RepID=A0A7J5Z3L9_DISMA|nr:hypothetical protein F7725_016454 [Dissostichus mawsoni]